MSGFQVEGGSGSGGAGSARDVLGYRSMQTGTDIQASNRVTPRLTSDASEHHREAVAEYGPFHRVWSRFHLAHGVRPMAGALVVGGVALVLATEFGVTELAMAAAATYASYRMLRFGIDLKEALTETVQLEHAAIRGP